MSAITVNQSIVTFPTNVSGTTISVSVSSQNSNVTVSTSDNIYYQVSDTSLTLSVDVPEVITANVLADEISISVSGAGNVRSVNGYTGDVILTASDVGSLEDAPSDGEYYARKDGAWEISPAGGGAVDSVNGQTGVVVIAIPSKTSDLTNDSNFVADASYVHTDNNFTNTLKTKLDGVEAGAEVNVNADWNSISGDSQILNKPSIPSKTSDLTNDSNFVADAGYVHTDVNFTSTLKTKLDGIADGAEVNVNADWSAVSGDAQILNKPTIPTKTSDLTNDSNFVADASYVHTDVNFTSTLKTKLDGIADGAEVNVNADWNAVSGDAQILNKPSIPTALSQLSDDATHRLVTDTEKSTWNGKQDGIGYTPVNKGGDTMTGDLIVPDEAYSVSWDNSLEVPTKNALYDKIQTLSSVGATVNTEAVILASTPTSGLIAYGTDTRFFYVADGTAWNRASLQLYRDSANPDMGALQNNSKDGYYATFITDKFLYNVILKGFSGVPYNGAIRINTSVTPNTFEIYMRDTGWYTVVYDLSSSLGFFVHYPFSATQAVKVWNGNSVQVGLNGRPIISAYKTSMGAFPPKQILSGG